MRATGASGRLLFFLFVGEGAFIGLCGWLLALPISSLLVKLEPILTVSMGSLIGVILLAVYLPMIDYMNHLN